MPELLEFDVDCQRDTMLRCLKRGGSFRAERWHREGELKLDPRMPGPGGEMGSKPCGYWQCGDQRTIVYAGDAPAPGLRAKMCVGQDRSPLLMYDPSAAGTAVHEITSEDAWVLQGHDRAFWRQLMSEGENEEAMLAWALRGATPKLARWMATWATLTVARRGASMHIASRGCRMGQHAEVARGMAEMPRQAQLAIPASGPEVRGDGGGAGAGMQ